MARAATNDEKTSFRTEGQRTELFLAIHSPATVYTARINQSFTSWDDIDELTYDGGSGTLGDVLEGMTMYVGSSAGAFDKDMVRIRKTPGASAFYIGETSDIEYADNDYLTVVDDFDLWARRPLTKLVAIDDTNVEVVKKIDYDLAYTSQHANPAPFAVMGTHTVLWLTGATVDFEPNASGSWCIDGGAITDYLWTAPGASATSGLDTATPTITYDTAGTYRVGCTVTAANGATATGYRYVFVYDDDNPPVTQFTLERCIGDWEDGGWRFEVKLYDQAALTEIRERALVVLFARDFYGGTEESIGPLAGYEHVIAVGRIDGESITWNPELGEVEFMVLGPAGQMGMLPVSPINLVHSSGAAAKWDQMQGLTVDKAVWHMLQWRSTASRVMDIVNLSGDTRLLGIANAGASSLWEQIKTIGEGNILAYPVCDRYGRFYLEIDSQMLETGDRAGIPVVQEIAKTDWREDILIDCRVRAEVDRLEVSGRKFNGSKEIPLFSHAAGKVFKPYGRHETRDGLLFSSQADANTVTGLLIGWLNCRYPLISIPLASNQRLVDICPRQYVTLSIAAGDTPRGLTWSEQKLVIRRVELQHEAESGALLTDLEGETETNAELSTTWERPQTPQDNQPPQPLPELPPYEQVPLPPMPDGGIQPPPEEIPPETGIDTLCRDDLSYPENGPFNLFNGSRTLNSTDGSSLIIPFRAALRSPAADYISAYQISASFQSRTTNTTPIGAWGAEATDDWYSVYALDDNYQRIAAGVHDAVTDANLRTGTFDNVALVDIAAIEIYVNRVDLVPIASASQYYNHPNFSLGVHSEGWYWRSGMLVCWWDVVVSSVHTGGVECFLDIVKDGGGNYFSTNEWWDVFLVYKELVSSSGSGGSPCGAGYYSEVWDVALRVGPEASVYYSGDYAGNCLQSLESHPVNNYHTMWSGPSGFGNLIKLSARAIKYTGVSSHQIHLYGKVTVAKAATRRIVLNSFNLYNLCGHS